MAKNISLAVDAGKIANKAAERYGLDLPPKIVMMHYDDASDTLYLHFEYPSKAVDSEVVDEHGEIIMGLDEKGHIVNMTVVNASTIE